MLSQVLALAARDVMIAQVRAIMYRTGLREQRPDASMNAAVDQIFGHVVGKSWTEMLWLNLRSAPGWLGGSLLVTVSVLLMLLAIFDRWRRVRSDTQARQAAARGDSIRVLLAAEQPDRNEPPIRLPFSIELRPRWGSVLTVAVLFATGQEVGVAIVLVLTGSSVRNALLDPAAAIVVIGVMLFWLASREARQRIVVEDEGLKVVTSSGQKGIRWTEAQVFAISPRGRARVPPVFYELCGGANCVTWVRLRPSMAFVSLRAVTLTEPTTPFPEYDRQMEVVLSFIAARTGLSLYDLRSAGSRGVVD